MFFSCGKEPLTPKHPVSEMYKTSELAQLMRDMYSGQEQWKKEIENGKIPKDFPEKYKKIHTAIATDSTVRTDVFTIMSDEYLRSIQKIINSENSQSSKKNFNEMVNKCIVCHQSFCPGPISRIQKLKINK